MQTLVSTSAEKALQWTCQDHSMNCQTQRSVDGSAQGVLLWIRFFSWKKRKEFTKKQRFSRSCFFVNCPCFFHESPPSSNKKSPFYGNWLANRRFGFWFAGATADFSGKKSRFPQWPHQSGRTYSKVHSREPPIYSWNSSDCPQNLPSWPRLLQNNFLKEISCSVLWFFVARYRVCLKDYVKLIASSIFLCKVCIANAQMELRHSPMTTSGRSTMDAQVHICNFKHFSGRKGLPVPNVVPNGSSRLFQGVQGRLIQGDSEHPHQLRRGKCHKHKWMWEILPC